MAAQIEDPIGLAEIVKSSGMTLRSMVRLFGKELNTTPGQFYLNLRLARARAMRLDSRSAVSAAAWRESRRPRERVRVSSRFDQ